MKTPMEPNEKDLMQSIENGEWIPMKEAGPLMDRLKKAAKKTSVKDFRLNLRISQADVEAIKVRALQEGIPYQTLIASVLHKYAKGKLIERRG